jgi:hypothetical protein
MIKNGRWMVQARFPDEDVENREFSMSVLGKITKGRKTFYQSGANLQNESESVMGIEAVIASPIFDKADNVVGAIYGVRNKLTAGSGSNIGVNPLEAQIVQLLASSVGAGLARQEQEAEAGRLRISAFFPADCAGRGARVGWSDDHLVADCGGLCGPSCHGPAGYEKAGGLFIGGAHGFCDAGVFRLQ